MLYVHYTCVVLYVDDCIHRQCLLLNTICIVIKYAQLDIFLKYREMLFIFKSYLIMNVCLFVLLDM